MILIVAVCLVVRAGTLVAWGNVQTMNPDEETNYTIALNHLQGKGYTINGKPTAFHGSFPVFLYEWLIDAGISKHTYVVFIHITAIFLFLASIGSFHRLARRECSGRHVAVIAAALYALYPSNLLYIGLPFCYEKIGLPLLVFVFSGLRAIAAGEVTDKSVAGISTPVLVTASCLLRPQLVLVFFTVFTVFLVVRKKGSTSRPMFRVAGVTFLIGAVAHIPALKKNAALFGEPVISTQLGFEFMQGHNDLARGSWRGTWLDPTDPYARYSRAVIPGLDKLNELQESRARLRFARKWIKDHPRQEVRLIARKLGIYFLPRNYEAGYNLVNGLVHLAFLVALATFVVRRTAVRSAVWLLSPVLGSILLSLVFFTGYRWRYYAEPFMILFAAGQLLQERGWRAGQSASATVDRQ